MRLFASFNGALTMESIIVWLLSWTVGAFFFLARFRFFYDPSKPRGLRWLNQSRQESLAQKMVYCGMRNWPLSVAWFVASVEVIAALMLLAGWHREIAALLLLGILAVATRCTAKKKVMEQHPVDYLDIVCSYLWRVEGLYIVMVLCILAASVPL
jgi:uncharacterized membrane protein YphA (DoxX/SURF4 family)